MITLLDHMIKMLNHMIIIMLDRIIIITTMLDYIVRSHDQNVESNDHNVGSQDQIFQRDHMIAMLEENVKSDHGITICNTCWYMLDHRITISLFQLDPKYLMKDHVIQSSRHIQKWPVDV